MEKNENQETGVQEGCGAKTEVYSRVVGFYRPVSQWNRGKKEEFNDRETYVIAK